MSEEHKKLIDTKVDHVLADIERLSSALFEEIYPQPAPGFAVKIFTAGFILLISEKYTKSLEGEDEGR